MFILDETLKLVRRQTVLCVGDLMLDEFVYGEVARISPEAPTAGHRGHRERTSCRRRRQRGAQYRRASARNASSSA